jgi:hypothetical protein
VKLNILARQTNFFAYFCVSESSKPTGNSCVGEVS